MSSLPHSAPSNIKPSSKPSQNPTSADLWSATKTLIKLYRQAPPITPVSPNTNLPLSFAQERLWTLDQLDTSNPVYNFPTALRLQGSLNIPALEQSLREIIRRHSILRTTFPLVDGQPVQQIASDTTFTLPIIDLSQLPPEQQDIQCQQQLTQEAQRPFNLIQEPGFRVNLLRYSNNEHILFLGRHHITFDGWSFQTFFRELATLYTAFSQNKPSPLPELPIQYADFALWQRQWLQGEVLELQQNYWKQQLSGTVEPLQLPTDKPRLPIHTYRGASQHLELSQQLTEALNTLSQQEGVTLFITLLAAFKALLHQYTGQDDIILCSPVAGRNRPETKELIGYFNNILPMRTPMAGNPTFRELIGRVNQVVLGAYPYQDLPFQHLVDLPNLTHIPLSRGAFIFQNYQSNVLSLPGLTVSAFPLDNQTSNFDLSMTLYENGGQSKLTGLVRYKTDLFEAETISQLIENFIRLLEKIVTHPETQIESLPSFSKTENNKQFNPTINPTHIESLNSREHQETFVAPRDNLELQLTQIWEKVLGKKPISINDNFFSLGGHSLLAVRLFAQIEKTFGKTLPLATLFQAATIEELANIFRQSGYSPPWQTLVPIQPNGVKQPFFGVHTNDGSVLFYRHLVPHLNPDQPFYGLQAPVQDGKQIPFTRLEDKAAHYIKEIRTLQPSGPYLLGGFCIGGVIAFEMAQQLVAQGEQVALLALFDSFASFPSSLRSRISLHFGYFLSLEPQEKLIYLLTRLVGRMKRLAKTIQKFYPGVNSHKASPYTPQIYPGRVTLFRASKQLPITYHLPDLGWGKLAGEGVEVHHIPGAHTDIVLNEPFVSILAEELQACINKAQAELPESNTSESHPLTTGVQNSTAPTCSNPPPKIKSTTHLLNPSEQSASWDSLVLIKSGGVKPPLFLVHDGDGELMLYLNLARHLDSERPVYGLQPHSQEDFPILHTRIGEMVTHYIEKIRTVQPEGPYLLGGLCAGGTIAFEIAHQLQAQGYHVALVALIDAADIQAPLTRGRITRQRWNRFSQALNQHQQFKGLTGLTYILKTVTTKVNNLIAYESRTKIFRLQNKLKVRLYRYYLDNKLPLPKFLRNISVRTIYGFAIKEHIPQIYPGQVVLFRATETIGMDNPSIDDTPALETVSDPLFGWGKRATGGVEVYDIPGGHSSMLQEPNVQVLAEKMEAYIKTVLSEESDANPPSNDSNSTTQ